MAVSSVVGAVLAACTPTLNWRDVLVGETGVQALFPCKPDQAMRQVPLAGKAVGMTLLSCSAGGLQFAIATVSSPDAPAAGRAAAELRRLSALNLGASAPVPVAASVPGLSANDSLEGYRLSGQVPGRGPIEQQVVLFTHDAAVVQASVVGTRIDPDAADTFFSGLRVPR